MGTVAEKLGRLQETKHAIRAALEEKGQAVADGDSFASYAEKIRAIESGGGGAGTPPDPVKVYKETRPADWLPMPEPQDDEIYLLFHIPDGLSSLLAFTATCTGDYTVETGTVINGAFTAQTTSTLASGARYEAELFAEDYGDLTGDGFKQVMLRVSGTDIETWAPTTHSKKTAPNNFCGWNIMEIACRLPSGTRVACGSSTGTKALKKLRYFTWVGENMATNMGGMFLDCSCLIAIPQLNTSKTMNMSSMFYCCTVLTALPQMDTFKVTDMYQMFYCCCSLPAIPQLNTAKITNAVRMFHSCYSLTALPPLDTSKVTNMTDMFYDCYSLTALPPLDTSKVTNMNDMFYGCLSLTTIPQMDTSSVTNMNYMFTNCYSLSSVKFKPEVTGWAGVSVSFSGCSLSRAAIVQLFESLPAITEAKALTLTGNPGVSELTDADKAIATQKGWTLTL